LEPVAPSKEIPAPREEITIYKTHHPDRPVIMINDEIGPT